ncbi:MAG: hypothetical protein N4A41_03500 [Crocinitomicaceae bacterium]|jgi:hypothetical protein|nr:hypothetical protein [Crocinitomicaceae bacterium]
METLDIFFCFEVMVINTSKKKLRILKQYESCNELLSFMEFIESLDSDLKTDLHFRLEAIWFFERFDLSEIHVPTPSGHHGVNSELTISYIKTGSLSLNNDHYNILSIPCYLNSMGLEELRKNKNRISTVVWRIIENIIDIGTCLLFR